jgi:Lecithin:cholesterol acyltransferase
MTLGTVLPQPLLAQTQDPVVVFVHGRAQQAKSDDELRTEWVLAFDRGMAGIGASGLIPHNAVRFVFYQDLYRDGATVTCPADQERARETLAPRQAALEAARQNFEIADRTLRQRRSELQLITTAMGQQNPLDPAGAARLLALNAQLPAAKQALEFATVRAAQADTEVENAATELAGATATVEEMLRQQNNDFQRSVPLISWDRIKSTVFDLASRKLSSSRLVQRAAIDWLFTDTKRYIQNWPYRCATDARLLSILDMLANEKRRIILVTHSMGSLVTFHVLKQLDSPVGEKPLPLVSYLISVGSQLGVLEFMPALISGYKPPLPVPRGILRWRNLRGRLDYVAPRLIGGLYDTSRMIPSGFSEWLINTPDENPHDISGYLSNPATARTIAFSWCKGFGLAQPPGQCNSIRDIQQGDGGATAVKR